MMLHASRDSFLMPITLNSAIPVQLVHTDPMGVFVLLALLGCLMLSSLSQLVFPVPLAHSKDHHRRLHVTPVLWVLIKMRLILSLVIHAYRAPKVLSLGRFPVRCVPLAHIKH